jgi:hypothetical protein
MQLNWYSTDNCFLISSVPDLDLLVRGTDPDPSITKVK